MYRNSIICIVTSSFGRFICQLFFRKLGIPFLRRSLPLAAYKVCVLRASSMRGKNCAIKGSGKEKEKRKGVSVEKWD